MIQIPSNHRNAIRLRSVFRVMRDALSARQKATQTGDVAEVREQERKIAIYDYTVHRIIREHQTHKALIHILSLPPEQWDALKVERFCTGYAHA